jgi:hypothetical protein
MAKEGRQGSKDPMPTERNSCRLGKDGGGNTPVTGEKHDAKKAERVSVASRYDDTAKSEQPTRNEGGKTTQHGIKQSGGNVAADQCKEMHDGKKAERVAASSRF